MQFSAAINSIKIYLIFLLMTVHTPYTCTGAVIHLALNYKYFLQPEILIELYRLETNCGSYDMEAKKISMALRRQRPKEELLTIEWFPSTKNSASVLPAPCDMGGAVKMSRIPRPDPCVSKARGGFLSASKDDIECPSGAVSWGLCPSAMALTLDDTFSPSLYSRYDESCDRPEREK